MRFVNNLKTAALLGALIGLCMWIGHAMGGPGGMLIGLVLGGLGNIIAFFFSDKIALMSMHAQPIERSDVPWLYDMIERLSQRAGLPMPRVYVCPQDAPNAFATGRSPSRAAVAITKGMLQHFPEHEIEGVMAHEIAHIKHRDMLISTIAAVLAGMISYAGYMLMYLGGGGHSREGGNPLGLIGVLAMVILAPIAAMLIQLAISRQREYAADSLGGELCGDPMKLAHALARLDRGNSQIPMDTNPSFNSLFIMKPLSRGGLTSIFSTHPPTQKRIDALVAQAQRVR